MSKTILFVDDDADDRDLLLAVVQDVNPSVNVVFAENGKIALDYLRKEQQNQKQPCLIVLDLNMPVLDGKETYRKIKTELMLDAPVIIFTSSLNPNDKAMFNKLGVEFISKPDDFAYMNKVVSHMISVCGNNGIN